MCIAPFAVKSTDIAKTVWAETQYINVPCGNCNECVRSRQAAWLFRLEQQLRETPTAGLITLTYMDHELEWNSDGEATLVRKHLTTFTDTMKKRHDRLGLKFKYFGCGEYGSSEFTNRPHYHVLTMSELPTHRDIAMMTEDIWLKGRSEYKPPRPDQSISGAMNYVLKYMDKQKAKQWIKDSEQWVLEPNLKHEWQQMSKGIGSNFTEVARRIIDTGVYEVPLLSGHRISIPRYYWKQIYGDAEKYFKRPQIMAKQKEAEAEYQTLGAKYGFALAEENRLATRNSRQNHYLTRTSTSNRDKWPKKQHP